MSVTPVTLWGEGVVEQKCVVYVICARNDTG